MDLSFCEKAADEQRSRTFREYLQFHAKDPKCQMGTRFITIADVPSLKQMFSSPVRLLPRRCSSSRALRVPSSLGIDPVKPGKLELNNYLRNEIIHTCPPYMNFSILAFYYCAWYIIIFPGRVKC